MSASPVTPQPLPPERSRYMGQAAVQCYRILERFSGGPVASGQEGIQLLDEWIDRMTRKAPLSAQARVQVIAFLGQAFLGRHGGYWAMQIRDKKPTLGIVCPVVILTRRAARGPDEDRRFIDISDQVQRRLTHGMAESLAFFYLTTGMELGKA